MYIFILLGAVFSTTKLSILLVPLYKALTVSDEVIPDSSKINSLSDGLFLDTFCNTI